MIRQAVAADLPRLLSLAAEMHRESRFRDYPYDEGKVATLLANMITNAGGECFVWVTEIDGVLGGAGNVVGGLVGQCYQTWFSSAKVAGDFGLFLHPDHRGGTAAMRLVKQFQAWAADQGAIECEMGCNTGVNPEKYGEFMHFMGFREVAQIYMVRL